MQANKPTNPNLSFSGSHFGGSYFLAAVLVTKFNDRECSIKIYLLTGFCLCLKYNIDEQTHSKGDVHDSVEKYASCFLSTATPLYRVFSTQGQAVALRFINLYSPVLDKG